MQTTLSTNADQGTATASLTPIFDTTCALAQTLPWVSNNILSFIEKNKERDFSDVLQELEILKKLFGDARKELIKNQKRK